MPVDLYCRCGRALEDYMERVNGECKTCMNRNQKAPAAVQVENNEPKPTNEEGSVDPVTKRLFDDALPRHGEENCPKCWHQGRFIRMALVCPKHGVFAGA